MGAYADITKDLQRMEPTDVPTIISPYSRTDTFEEQFNLTYASLQRNNRLKSRILALLDAYFLGKLLNETPDRTTRVKYNRKLTTHYLRMAENTFDIFEFHPEQIQRTQTIDAQRLRKLPRHIVRNLRDTLLMTFAGAQDSREGRLLPENELDDVTIPNEPERSAADEADYFGYFE